MLRLRFIDNSCGDNMGRWLRIAFAGLVYMGVNLLDYLLTVHGISNGLSQEANTLVLDYMTIFGMKTGLLMCKLLMGSFIIFGVFVFDMVCRERNIRFKSDYILYGGSIMTAMGASLWLAKL